MDQLARILTKILKITGWLLVGAAIIAVVVGIGNLMYEGYWDWQKSKVLVTAELGVSRCVDGEFKDAFPVLLTFKNTSSYTIQETSFRVELRRKRRSTNLFDRQYFTSDRIVKPNEVYMTCYGRPKWAHRSNKIFKDVLDKEFLKKPENFIVSVERGRIEFE